MVDVKVPKKNTYFFNLYVNGDIIYSYPRGDDILFSVKGAFILQYKYKQHRRIYLVNEIQNTQHCKTVYLPNVKNKVSLIYSITGGRKIDLLRQAIFNLEEIGGKEIYSFPTIFWQKFSCLLDSFDGYKSKATKTNLILLHEQYKNWRK